MPGVKDEDSRSFKVKSRGPDKVMHPRMHEFEPRPTSRHKVFEITHLMVNLALVFVMKEGSVENVKSSDLLPITSL